MQNKMTEYWYHLHFPNEDIKLSAKKYYCRKNIVVYITRF